MYNTVFDELFGLSQEMNRLFDKAGVSGTAWPNTNIYESKDEYIMVSKIPGVAKEDIQVTLKDNSLKISGERKKGTPEKTRLLLEERSSGRFERNILLNEKIDSEKIEAETSNGLLIVKLPKSPEVKPKRIEIK